MGKIADVSKWQGTIDWGLARQELDFVILRASCGTGIDTKYLHNVAECGIPFGVYHYVKAGTAADAKVEAQFFVQCTKQGSVQPCFYVADIEYEAQTESTTEPVCVAFLETLRELGCGKIGMYINRKYKWAGKAIAMCDFMWIPHWGKNDGEVPADKYKSPYPHDLWQYTSKGTLAGVKGDVDLNVLTGTKPVGYFTSAQEAPVPGATDEGSVKPMLTNLQLVAYMLAVYAAKWVYWYGTCGYECTTSLYTRKKNQYPSHYGSSRESAYKADIATGKMCADCVGVIKSFFWSGGIIGGVSKYGSNNCPDRSANGLFGMCKETGSIKTIPEIPGLVVWKDGHIGVYIGGGYTIELRGFSYDCVKRKVTDGPWTKWGKLPPSMLTYVTDGSVTPEPDNPSTDTSESEVVPVPVCTVRVTTSNGGPLNFRAAPNKNAKDIGDIPNGTLLPVIEKTSDEWYKVMWNDQQGYVSTGYLTEVETVTMTVSKEVALALYDALRAAIGG